MLSSIFSAMPDDVTAASREVLGMNRRNRCLIDQFNLKRHRKLANNKIMSKQVLIEHGLPVAKTFAVISTLRSASQIINILEELEHFVIKPAQGAAGSGIAVLGPKTQRGWQGNSGELWSERDIYKRVGEILIGDFGLPNCALIEERLFAGPLLGDFPVHGLPDIRIITLHSDPIMAMVRLPTWKSGGKANIHLGAVALGVDIDTGRTTTAMWCHRPIKQHPDTNLPTKGLQIAAWSRILEVARSSARAFPLPYLGIDIILTTDLSPIVMEVNIRPGLEIQNANRKGLRPYTEHVLGDETSRGGCDCT